MIKLGNYVPTYYIVDPFYSSSNKHSDVSSFISHSVSFAIFLLSPTYILSYVTQHFA